jgi:hypothetical protein
MLPVDVFGQVDQSVTQVGDSPVWNRDSQGRIITIGIKGVQYSPDTGVVTMIGNNPVIYNEGKISQIGDKAVRYDSQNPKRFSSIGNNAIIYDRAGRIAQMGLNMIIRKEK